MELVIRESKWIIFQWKFLEHISSVSRAFVAPVRSASAVRGPCYQCVCTSHPIEACFTTRIVINGQQMQFLHAYRMTRWRRDQRGISLKFPWCKKLVRNCTDCFTLLFGWSLLGIAAVILGSLFPGNPETGVWRSRTSPINCTTRNYYLLSVFNLFAMWSYKQR